MHGLFIVGKSTEAESRLVVARGEVGQWMRLLNGCAAFGEIKKILAKMFWK